MLYGCVLTSLIYMQLSNFPSTTCWRDCLFPIWYSCLLCWRLIDHRCVSGLSLCSNDPYVCFCTNTTLFWLLQLGSFVVLSEVWESFPSSFFFPPPGSLWQFWVFMVPCKFLDYSTSVKNVMGNLIRIALNLWSWAFYSPEWCNLNHLDKKF